MNSENLTIRDSVVEYRVPETVEESRGEYLRDPLVHQMWEYARGELGVETSYGLTGLFYEWQGEKFTVDKESIGWFE